MKRLAKVFSIFLALFLLFLVPLGCVEDERNWYINYDNYPKWKTAYTEQQHKKRVETLLMQMEEHFNNPIKTVTMHTVYSYYTEDPEYILITIEHENYYEGTFARKGVTYDYQTKYSHTVLQIINDAYYYTPLYAYADVYRRPKLGFCYGLSPYETCGYINDKKFFGYYYNYTGDEWYDSISVEDNGDIKIIYRPGNKEAEWEFDFLEVAPKNEVKYEQIKYKKNSGELKKRLYESRNDRYIIPRIKFYSW
jgi:hypothetical protein